MPVSDFYTHASGLVTLATTSETPVFSVFGVAAKRGWGIAVRIKVGNTAAAAGNNLRFRLARPGNTPNASATNTAGGNDYSAPTGQLVNATAYTTAPTVGAVLADWEVPQASGSEWVEYPIQGAEWGIPAIANDNANAGIHVFVTPSVATSTPVSVDIVVSE
jgi:hypothetical protein